jgi:MFS family permease
MEVNDPMSMKFLTNMALAIIGGFLVVASQTFATHAVAWLAFAIGIGAVVIAVAGQVDRTRGIAQRVLDLATLALGGVTMGFSVAPALAGSTVVWLSLAWGLGFVALAVAGLTLHEVDDWRAEHRLPRLRGLHEPEDEARKPSLAA